MRIYRKYNGLPETLMFQILAIGEAFTRESIPQISNHSEEAIAMEHSSYK